MASLGPPEGVCGGCGGEGCGHLFGSHYSSYVHRRSRSGPLAGHNKSRARQVAPLAFAKLAISERVSRPQFREQREVAVPGEQRLSSVGDADRRYPRVVDDTSNYSGAPHEALECPGKVVGLADKARGGRASPGCELGPRLLGTRCAVPPDAGVGDHTEELIATGPWNGPGCVTLRQSANDGSRRPVFSRLPAVGIHQDIRVDCDHRGSESP